MFLRLSELLDSVKAPRTETVRLKPTDEKKVRVLVYNDHLQSCSKYLHSSERLNPKAICGSYTLTSDLALAVLPKTLERESFSLEPFSRAMARPLSVTFHFSWLSEKHPAKLFSLRAGGVGTSESVDHD